MSDDDPVAYDKAPTGLLVIDPYNDFISPGGKVWDRLKGVIESNDCVTHMQQAPTAIWISNSSATASSRSSSWG